ncbi:SH3 domain-containing protein [Rhizobium sp. C1]|uniref:SH3 domain-containing protein n=1 Tax=Rhizobium sp. C1 TaxID=1349799 RepID=UPI003FA71F98
MKVRWWILGVVGSLYLISHLGSNEPHRSLPTPPQANSPVQSTGGSSPAITEKSDSETSDPPRTGFESQRTERLYVTGHRVAFRAAPDNTASILDRFDPGRRVQLLGTSDQWSHVKDELTQRDGWIFSRLLGVDDPTDGKSQDEQSKPAPKKVEPPKPPLLSDATIIARIISESISSYPGNCPCPNNRDRAGHKCGRRSAYSRPGGYSPVCYPTDVTKAMIEAFRNAVQ